jgi:pSer/pThr/pTyr-binding forkhead associated (FHA) protein
MPQVKLRVISGKQQGSEISLQPGKFLVGREEDCHLRPNSDLVSRHHCVFTVDDFGVRLRDLGSTNGTFVNGERLRGAVVLNQNDRVVIGKLELDVVIGDGVGTDTQMVGAAESDTSLGKPLVVAAGPEAAPVEPSTSATISQLPPVHEAAAAAPQMMPAPPSGDTQFYPPNMMPGYQVPVGYPPQYPQYGGYPGYPPQMPGYYPQMGYPMQGMMPGMPMQPMQGYPQQGAPQEPAAPPTASAGGIEVKLPDPETTGAKDVVIGSNGTGGKSGPAIPQAADDIIKQYMTRR